MESDLIASAIDELDDIFYVFTPDGEYIEWNDQLSTVTGYSDGELDDKEPNDLFTGDDRSAVKETIATVIETEQRNAVQAEIKTKRGTEIPYELSFAPLDREGELEAIAGIGRDISKRLENERRLRELAAEIRSKSMPVVEIWDGVILTTIVGALDTQQAENLTEDLLQSIVEVEASVALIDITGVEALDTATAQHLIDTVNAVDLLGSDVIITGISPEIAQTLVQIGIRLEGIETQSSLMEGLRQALTWRGVAFD
jgi:rsbT co-antagonist protein RsbR